MREFRIFCEEKRGRPTGPYYTVYLFDGRKEMRAWANQHETTGRKNAFRIRRPRHSYKNIPVRLVDCPSARDGVDCLLPGNIGSGIVSHEMTHAAVHYLTHWRPQIKNIIAYSEAENPARVQGWLVRQFCASIIGYSQRRAEESVP